MSVSSEGWLLPKGQGTEDVTSMARPGQAKPDQTGQVSEPGEESGPRLEARIS